MQPNSKYTRDPFCPLIEDGKLYGLGSNDAGGALVSLMASFIYFYQRKNLSFNILFAATAEEEISGANGIEKGLVVLDCIAHGVAGHTARDEGENAIYKALTDIEWFRTFKFPKVSQTLGEVKMTVSVLKSGSQHNVVPDSCSFTVDVRTTDVYSNSETIELIKKNVSCEVVPRSVRLNSSSIHLEHPIVRAGVSMGLFPFGSPTLSDQSLMNFPSLKMGPGDSARSHTADEFIFIHEIEEAVEMYIQLFKNLTLDN